MGVTVSQLLLSDFISDAHEVEEELRLVLGVLLFERIKQEVELSDLLGRNRAAFFQRLSAAFIFFMLLQQELVQV